MSYPDSCGPPGDPRLRWHRSGGGEHVGWPDRCPAVATINSPDASRPLPAVHEYWNRSAGNCSGVARLKLRPPVRGFCHEIMLLGSGPIVLVIGGSADAAGAPASPCGDSTVVRRGDTLSTIAQRCEVSEGAILGGEPGHSRLGGSAGRRYDKSAGGRGNGATGRNEDQQPRPRCQQRRSASSPTRSAPRFRTCSTRTRT